ncbi:glycine cleavage system protein H [Streptomyces longwoodensis]|uniref:glycine cleavage system protein H n=1 Tax=Streptomyces longwoodensis TaxID=68231 RepID=UPI0037018C2B
MSEPLFTKDHVWLSREGEICTVGVTGYQFADVVFVDLPEEGRIIRAGESVGTVETVADNHPVYSPISGRVIEKNVYVEQDAGRVNKSPFGQGWLFSVLTKPDARTVNLLDLDEYEQMIGTSLAR